jgi:hypothetical protein
MGLLLTVMTHKKSSDFFIYSGSTYVLLFDSLLTHTDNDSVVTLV